jgi:hypothetical protein
MIEMKDKENKVSLRVTVVTFLVILNVIFIKAGLTSNANWYWFMVITLPLLIFAVVNGMHKTPSTQNNNND